MSGFNRIRCLWSSSTRLAAAGPFEELEAPRLRGKIREIADLGEWFLYRKFGPPGWQRPSLRYEVRRGFRAEGIGSGSERAVLGPAPNVRGSGRAEEPATRRHAPALLAIFGGTREATR